MGTAVQYRRGTTINHSTFIGLEGEITIDTTKNVPVVHDGLTTGGIPTAKASDVTDLANTVDAGLNTKVDKVVGKQLSTEDYTTIEKNKLANLVNSGRIIQYKQFVMNSKETTMSTNYINSSAFLLFTPMLADSTIVFKVNVAGYINDVNNFMLCKLRSVNDSADIIPYLFLHKHIDVSGYSTPIACGMYKTTSWGNTQKEFRIQFASSSGTYVATLNGNGHGNILNGATFIEIYEIGA